MQQHLKKQSGTALLMALMLMTITAIIATSIAFRQQISIKRTEQVLTTQQAYLYVQAVNDWAAAKLLENGKQYTPNKPLDTFPMAFDEKVNGVSVKGEIIDAQGFFNLNTLSSPDAQTAFTQLIRTVDSDIDKKEAAQITQAVYQWITPLRIIQQTLAQQTTSQPNTPATGISAAAPTAAINENKSTYKIWDQSYLNQNPPYNIPHLPMASASELRLVHGITRDLYSELAPFIIALPNLGSQINVNTAPAEVLAATAQGLSLNAAKLIVDNREQKPFNNLTAYETSPDLTNATVTASVLTAQSQYFLVKASIVIGEQHLTVYTLMLREGVAGGDNTNTDPNNAALSVNNNNSSLNTAKQPQQTENAAPSITIKTLWQSIGGY